MFLAAKEFPLPVEYRFLPLEEVFHEPPADLADRVVIFLDCGNIDRMPVDFLRNGENKVLNIDHHHDNTRFGTLNLVDVDASCTAEILYQLAGLLGVELTPEIANALYVGLITDTGNFMYENTDARSHRMAAALIEAGVDVNGIYRRLYEHAPLEKLKLVGEGARGIERFEDGLLVGHLHLRPMTTARPARVSRSPRGSSTTSGRSTGPRSRPSSATRPTAGARPGRSACARPTAEVDVSAIARKQGGGGHRRAAGFGTDLDYPQVVEFLRDEVRSQL